MKVIINFSQATDTSDAKAVHDFLNRLEGTACINGQTIRIFSRYEAEVLDANGNLDLHPQEACAFMRNAADEGVFEDLKFEATI